MIQLRIVCAQDVWEKNMYNFDEERGDLEYLV